MKNPLPSPKGGYRHTHPAVEIPESALTPREKKVLAAIRSAGGPVAVTDLARRCFPGFRAKPGTYETTAPTAARSATPPPPATARC